MARRRAQYGFDAPGVLAGLATGAVAGLAAAVVVFVLGWWPLGLLLLLVAAFFGLNVASFTYTTRRGKFAVWEQELDRLALSGDERVLDLGCGRGAVLTAVARRLPTGWVIGVDL